MDCPQTAQRVKGLKRLRRFFSLLGAAWRDSRCAPITGKPARGLTLINVSLNGKPVPVVSPAVMLKLQAETERQIACKIRCAIIQNLLKPNPN